MATRTIEEESGAHAELPPPNSSAWMPRKLAAAASDSLDLISKEWVAQPISHAAFQGGLLLRPG